MRAIIVASCLLAGFAVSACTREASAWREARREDTAAAYEAYVAAHPLGSHAAEARAAIARLREAGDWARAERLGTPEAWQRYLARWPEGGHAATARQLLVDFIPPGRPAAPAPQAAGFEIQLGAWVEESSARAGLAAWAGRQADLGGLAPRLVPPPGEGPALWRLRAGPLDEAAARVVCEELRAAGTDCVPLPAASTGDAPP
jgi:hypothetical protein